jgi:NADPH2:quinone reductase
MSLQPGHRVVVQTHAENPLEAIDNHSDLVEQDPPDPSTLSPRDVIIAIKSAQVGWVDLLMTSGLYQHKSKPPYTPGLEYAGVVAWAGPEADIPVGARVLVDGSLAGPRSLGEYQAWGGFASYAVAPVEAVLPIPGDLSFDQACNLLGNYETAYHCLFTRGRLQAGETVLIHGAAGATGLAAVHLAKLVGANVIATGRSDDKLAIVKAEGADHVLKLDGSPLRARVQAICPNGVDAVYDGVGGELSVESLRCLRFGGRHLIVGWASTPFVAGKGANQLPTNLMMMKGLDVLGCPTMITTTVDPTVRPPRLAKILEWARAGKIHPHISKVFPLSDYRRAMRVKWNSEVVGGAVLHP